VADNEALAQGGLEAKDRIRTHRWNGALFLGIILSLVAVGVALAAGNIDLTNKWAWGANTGWVNFAPDHGGVSVYSDHLEGDAWGESVGWIKVNGTAVDMTVYKTNTIWHGDLLAAYQNLGARHGLTS
jgi:hypothetical protein